MTKRSKLLMLVGLITLATASLANVNSPMQIEAEQQHSGNFSPEDPAIYDLGLDWAVIFYYDNEQGERVVVTTIAPKDPDSDRTASEHIVTLSPGERYRVTLASSTQTSEPIQVALRFDEFSMLTAMNP